MATNKDLIIIINISECIQEIRVEREEMIEQITADFGKIKNLSIMQN